MTGLRVNVDPGGIYLDGWLNASSNPWIKSDVSVDVIDFIAEHGADITDLFLGRMLEELVTADAEALLRLIAERIPRGTRVSALAIDVRAACASLLAGEIQLAAFNATLIHATDHGRRQLGSFDRDSLLRLFQNAGFEGVGELTPADLEMLAGDLSRSPLLCSASALAPTAPTASAAQHKQSATAWTRPRGDATAEEMLLEQLAAVRAELARVRSREQLALRKGGDADRLSHELRDAQRTIADINRSITFRVAHRGSLVARRVLPKGSPQRKLAARIARAFAPATESDR